MNPLLTADRVTSMIGQCLFQPEEIQDGVPIMEPVVVEGIRATLSFHPDRLKEAEPAIVEMLQQLPETFKVGDSFLNLCCDRFGNHWGEHQHMEALVMLGIASQKMRYCFSREYWDALPGGMPYVVLEASV
jgi:hypothetical protein